MKWFKKKNKTETIDYKCLRCGGEFTPEDCMDTEFEGNIVVKDMVGTCNRCGAEHTWQEEYTLSAITNVKLL